MLFWKELDVIRQRWNGAWCIGGDWNISRFPSEKLGRNKITGDRRRFSNPINPTLWCICSLVVHPLLGQTISHPAMSKLDRFMVSIDWMDVYPEVFQLAFPKPASDHCPILFDSNCERWGPTPFISNLCG
eukprot:TRINITY_DN10442_c1_g2_i1.p1 TRINITY_DN10442_c1_g2~~TRINITY_DN10442_c1_g2_i1.p1  ORF type:complete len:130 (-),score=14.91 TRINITY_DN10442_c1_g2_i1:80-469(-)